MDVLPQVSEVGRRTCRVVRSATAHAHGGHSGEMKERLWEEGARRGKAAVPPRVRHARLNRRYRGHNGGPKEELSAYRTNVACTR